MSDNSLGSLYSWQDFKMILKKDKREDNVGLVVLQPLKWLHTGSNIF